MVGYCEETQINIISNIPGLRFPGYAVSKVEDTVCKEVLGQHQIPQHILSDTLSARNDVTEATLITCPDDPIKLWASTIQA